MTQALCAFYMLSIGILTIKYGKTTYTPGIYANVVCVSSSKKRVIVIVDDL